MAIGNVNPAKIRITPLAVVYTGRSNVASLLIEQHDGKKFVPLDLSAASVTRIQLIFPGVSPQILFDSQNTPAAFDQTQGATGILIVDLDTFAIDPGSYVAQLVFFDAAHALGQVIVDGSDNRLQFNFRSVSASGTPPAPVVQWVTEAPVDGQTYGRKDAGWTVVGAGGGNTSQGVANRITVTLAGTVYTIDIAATYVGQLSITTLGTITTGLWNGSVIDSAYGGAGAVNGLLKANGLGTVSAALAGTDYVAPGVITGSGLTMATARLLGRSTAGSGAVEEITVGANLTLSGGVLSATGGGGSALTVKDEGVNVDTAVVGINFVGAGVTATQASAGQVTVTIPGDAVTSVNSQTGAVVLDTDDVAEGVSNLYHTAARVLATALSGLSLATGGAIVATDTVLAAFGKIQKQLNDHFGAGGTVHALVTASVDGFMSAADKVKLDGVATGANNYVHPNHSGDVTSVGDGAQTIVANAVTNTKLADMAVNTIKGRIAAGTGDPEDLTAAQVRTIINVADGATANQTDAFLLARANHTGTQAISTVTGLQAALDSKISLAVVATFTGNKTLALTDINTYNVSQDGTAQTVTVPAQATVAWTADAEIHIEQGAAGTVTVTGATGVTVNGVSAGSFALAAQFSVVTLKRIGTNSWTLIGSLANSLVSGPATAGNGNLALFDGTTGKLIKDGGVVTAAGLALLDDASASAQRTTLGVAIGTDVQAQDADLQALADNATNGLWARIGAGTGAARTITGTASKVTVTNGDGVSGNPTLTLPAIISQEGIAFPATQVPSANANTLDDYEEGTWTPTLTFATPGDLSVVYSTRTGDYTKFGDRVVLNFNIVTSTFTHTTASGNAMVTGVPFTVGVQSMGAVNYQGITKTNYTSFHTRYTSATTTATIAAAGSGQGGSSVVTADMPTGGTVVLQGTGVFRV